MLHVRKPISFKEVENAFRNHDVVIYHTEGTKFILNPFGGGQTATEELRLSDDWALDTKDKLSRTCIIKIK